MASITTINAGDSISSSRSVINTNFANLNADVRFNLAEGFMQNGKITASVSSNNLTVALKTLAGTDPSASDPVYVRLGGVIRTITAALSITKNAGTNWFNSGSTDLATFDIDYFVYLGYNTTDGVVIGFSRIPYAQKYGDFNATSTNDRYAAISTITNASSTDVYQNIGRFNAILSATASFNWSIGTAVIINQPCYETRWLTYSPTTAFTAGAAPATLDTTNSCARYMLVGENCMVNLFRLYSSAGSTVTRCDLNLPFPNRNGAALLVSGTGAVGAGLTPVLCMFQQVNSNAIGTFCSSSSADRFSISCYFPY